MDVVIGITIINRSNPLLYASPQPGMHVSEPKKDAHKHKKQSDIQSFFA